MKRIEDISKRNALILILGIMVGLAVIGQPIAVNYVKSHTCCELKKKQQSDETTDDVPQNQEEISSLEAVAPTAQIQVLSVDYDILEGKISFIETIRDYQHAFNEKLSEKLLKVLFNYIIAPNAP
ncbi:hypothetical protein [Reichenbachiella agariperforans]|nr:hypothetical protein [Reichenbachiella agariperforans]